MSDFAKIIIVGIVVGYIFYTIITTLVNHNKKYSIIFSYNSSNIHIHHWILCLIILLLIITLVESEIIFIDKDIYYFTIGFLLGSIIHGLMYSDRFKIIY